MIEREKNKVTGAANGNPIKCDCGKLVAVERGGKIYVRCHGCKREVEVGKAEKK